MRKTIHRTTVLIWFVACFLSASPAQEVTARAWVDSTRYTVGDLITVHLELSHPGGVVFQTLVGDTVGGFQIIERPSLTSTNESTTAGRLIVAKYDSGEVVLPGIPFLYSLPGDSTSRRISTNNVPLAVHTVEVDTSQDIKDVKPPLSIAFTLAEIALYGGIALLVVGLSLFGYRYWKRRQQKKKGTIYTPPPKPAHVIALEELAVLREKKLWQQGLTKQYYSEGTEIIRRYIENRYGVMALEQTTDEIMDALKEHRLEADVLVETNRILRRADLVKFAKYQPDIPEHEEMLTVAHDIVARTRVVQMAPVATTEAKVAANVAS